MKNKSILITGASGFIGRNLLNTLEKYNYTIHTIQRNKTGHFGRLTRENVILHDIDLLDTPKLKKTLDKAQPSIIFHLANQGLFGGVQKDNVYQLKVNLLGTVNLINSLKDNNYEALINTGSSSEYGPKHRAMSENDSCKPNTFYGTSKLGATLYGSMEAKAQHKPIINLRLFSPYGPFDTTQRLIPYLILRALNNKPITLHDSLAVRDFTYVEDVIEAYLKSVEVAFKQKGETFNIGSSKQTKVADIVELIKKITKSKSKVTLQKRSSRPNESPVWKADNKKAERVLKWKPTTELEEGLLKTVKWFSDNQRYYKH